MTPRQLRRLFHEAANEAGIKKSDRHEANASAEMLGISGDRDRGLGRGFEQQVVAKGFHRIRHYGLLGNTNRTENIEHARRRRRSGCGEAGCRTRKPPLRGRSWRMAACRAQARVNDARDRVLSDWFFRIYLRTASDFLAVALASLG